MTLLCDFPKFYFAQSLPPKQLRAELLAVEMYKLTFHSGLWYLPTVSQCLPVCFPIFLASLLLIYFLYLLVAEVTLYNCLRGLRHAATHTNQGWPAPNPVSPHPTFSFHRPVPLQFLRMLPVRLDSENANTGLRQICSAFTHRHKSPRLFIVVALFWHKL